MALFEWSDEYSVKVTAFDNHHKKLVGFINELHEAMLKKQGNAVMDKILQSLIDYTKYHFSEEEKQMTQHGYTGYTQHKAEHEALVKQAVDFQTRFRSGNAGVTLEFMNFLKNWLKGHILGTDKRYSAFFNGKGVS